VFTFKECLVISDNVGVFTFKECLVILDNVGCLPSRNVL